MFGWLCLAAIGLSAIGFPKLLQILEGAVAVALVLLLFLVLSTYLLSTDIWNSTKCSLNYADACQYDTVFLPALHPNTPSPWDMHRVPKGATENFDREWYRTNK
jgi:hypothetical protein